MVATRALLFILLLTTTYSQTRMAPRPGRFDAGIEQQLANDLRGKQEYQDISFGVEDGVVTLAGNVRLHSERLALETRVRSLKHVAAVRSFVLLEPPTVADDILSGQLVAALRRADLEDLRVTAHEGKVEIAGDVTDRRQWSRVVNLVWSTPGVREADFRLRLMNSSN